MMQWIVDQEKRNLKPYKDEILQDYGGMCASLDAAVLVSSGERWWRGFKKRMDLAPGTAHLVETQRANAKLTTKEWEQFFHHCVKEALETANYNPQDIYNMDGSPFQVQYLSNTGQRVYTRRGSNQVWRKQGNHRKNVTLIGCVSAAGVTLALV